MFIAVATISILAITGAIWLLNRVLSFKICPFCAGVSGTWIWMLGALFLGYQIEPVVPALLMGGSVVGIAYQIEKRLSGNHSLLLWKILFIPTGFVAAYSILKNQWSAFVVSLVFLLFITFIFLYLKEKKAETNNKNVEELEEKMKNCC